MALLTTLLLIQAPVPGVEQKKPEQDSKPVVLLGCLDVPRFHVMKGEFGGARTLRLHARKSIMAMLKEHNGHADELTGVVKEGDRAMGGTKSKPVGDKTTIYVGARSETDKGELPSEPLFEIDALKHVGTPCSARR